MTSSWPVKALSIFYIGVVIAACKPVASKAPPTMSLTPTTVQQAEMLRKDAQYEKALSLYHAALAKNLQNVEAVEGIGLTYLAAGRYHEAAETFTQVLEIDALRWKSLNGLGVANILLGKPDQSVDYLSTAYDLSNEPVAVHNLGLAYAAQQRYPEAVLQLQRAKSAFELAGDQRKAKRASMNLALVSGLAKDFDSAESLLLTLLPKDKVYHELALYAKMADDPELAYAYIQESLSTSPHVRDKSWELSEELKNSIN